MQSSTITYSYTYGSELHCNRELVFTLENNQIKTEVFAKNGEERNLIATINPSLVNVVIPGKCSSTILALFNERGPGYVWEALSSANMRFLVSYQQNGSQYETIQKVYNHKVS